MKDRSALEIVFPRVAGYRVELPQDRLSADFSADSTLTLTPDMVGPGSTLLEGIIGEGVTMTVAKIRDMRPSSIAFELAKHILYKYFRDKDGEPKLHLFGQIKSVVRAWIDGGYLECKGGTGAWMIGYQDIADQAAERIYNAIAATIGKEQSLVAVLDPYNPKGSTSHVSFQTTKDLYTTAVNKCHVNYVTCDSDWEAEFARVAENHDQVLGYVKNQGLGLEVPYKDGSVARLYVPDFIVQIDDGHGPEDPLNLIIEIKGYRNENVKLKSETMRTQWVPGVNHLGAHGRWAFEEFKDVFEIEKEFGVLVERVSCLGSETEAAE